MSIEQQLDRGMIGSLVLNKTGPFISPEDLEDIISDVIVKALERQDYYDPEKAALSTWLSMLVHDVIYKRHQSTDALDVADIPLDEVSEGEDGELNSLYDSLNPEKLLNETNSHYYLKNKAVVNDALTRLPKEYRDVVFRKLIMGMAHEEVAKELDISIENSRKMFSRGVTMLRAIRGTEKEQETAVRYLTNQVNTEPQLNLTNEFDRAEYSAHLDECEARWAKNKRKFYKALDKLDEFDKQYRENNE